MGKVHARVARDLTLYVRQLAWLHAVPKPPEGSRRAQAADKLPQISRLDDLTRRKIEPQMPPNPMPHVIARLIEIGITETNGMGPAPLSWREIDAWQRSTAVRLQPWEARLIRKLSLAYIAEGRRSESETCPPPFRMGVTQREIESEDALLRSILG